MTTVLLAGGTGVFGRHITDVLTGSGYQVLSLGRGAGNQLRADLNDREQVLTAVSGVRAEIVVHAATALAKPPVRQRDLDATDRLRTVGMRHLVEAAGVVGAHKLITENVIFGYGYGPHGAGVLDESAPWGPAQANPHTGRHVAAMRVKEELTFATPGLDGVSLRFGMFYGPGGTDKIAAGLRKRTIPAPNTTTVLPWVHLVDAAQAVRAAIEQGVPGTAYNIVDDQPMGFGEYVRAVAAAYETPKPMSVPAWMLRPLGLLAEILRTDLRLSHDLATQGLGWQPHYPTVADGLAAAGRTTVR